MDGGSCAGTHVPRRFGLSAVLLGLTVLCFLAAQACRPDAAGAATATFGKTSVGASTEWFGADRKRVNKYRLPVAGALSELSVYLAPTSNTGQQVLQGIVYADSSGAPGRLLGTTSQLTFTSTSAAGWYRMTFPAALQLAAGEYWIGVITGASASVAGYRYDSVSGARAYNVNTYTAGPSETFGAFSTDSQQMSLYATYTPTEAGSPPTNVTAPAISGSAQEGMTLTASPGSWSGTPTSYSYQWQRCDPTGAGCSAIQLATSASYTVVGADVNSTLRVAVTAYNAAGPSAPTSSPQTAVVTSPAGTQRFGKTSVGASVDRGMFANYKIVHAATLSVSGSVEKLTVYAIPGTSSSPQALRAVIYADSAGSPGALVATGTQVTYTGSSNGSGWFDLPFGAPVALSAGTYWLGFTTGASSEGMGYAYDSVANARAYNTNLFSSGPSSPFGSSSKDSEQASLYATYTPTKTTSAPVNTTAPAISGAAQEGMTLTASPGSWSNSPSSFKYKWNRCDSTGASCSGISGATSSTYTLAKGDVGKTLRVTVTASNAAGSSAATSAQTALVAAAAAQRPANLTAPTISGTAQQGMTLSASPGSWSNSPTSYKYKWKRCNSAGASCRGISGATSSTYTLLGADVGSTLRVTVTAANAAGSSAASSPASAVVTSAGTGIQHLEYVMQDGLISVYDIDHEHKLTKTISLPQTNAGTRGASFAPSTHLLFISYGGDGGPNGNGSVLAYDLVSEKVVWDVKLNTGIDSGQLSADGKKLYEPTGELDPSGIWNILNTSNGAVTGKIQGGSGAHNTIASADGRYVYLGGRNYNYLDVYETATGKVREVGPLVNTVRPFTVNSANTLAYTTATDFDGFQVSSITTGKVLFTVSFATVPKEFAFTGPSHGVSLSPDGKQLYVLDAVNKEVRVYDVSKVSEGVAPAQLGVIALAGLTGSESPCAYDCGRGGWLQLSIDGRFLYVGDSGEVIDTATRKVVTTLSTLANTKKSLEIDWQDGVPIATSGRTGPGPDN